METKSILKYLRIYWQLFKFAAIADTTYRTSFFMMLFVEIAYIFVVFLSMKIIYANVGTIAGWNYYQMMVFLGVYSIFSELILGIAFIHNLRSLPAKIVNGELDLILTKPINSLFAVSLWRPYFALIPSFIPGLLAIYYGVHNGGLAINYWLIIPFLFLFFCGQVIAYSFGCIISTLSFLVDRGGTLAEFSGRNFIYGGKAFQYLFRFVESLIFGSYTVNVYGQLSGANFIGGNKMVVVFIIAVSGFNFLKIGSLVLEDGTFPLSIGQFLEYTHLTRICNKSKVFVYPQIISEVQT